MAIRMLQHDRPVRQQLYNFIFTAAELQQRQNYSMHHVQTAVNLVGRVMDQWDARTAFCVRLRTHLPALRQRLEALHYAGDRSAYDRDAAEAMIWWTELGKVLLTVHARENAVAAERFAGIRAPRFNDRKAAILEVLNIPNLPISLCWSEFDYITSTLLPNLATFVVDTTESLELSTDSEKAWRQLVVEMTYQEMLMTFLADRNNDEMSVPCLRGFRWLYYDNVRDAAALPDRPARTRVPITTTLNPAEISIDIECSICKDFDPVNDTLGKLSCQCAADYHNECVRTFLTMNDARSRQVSSDCPYCRQPIDTTTEAEAADPNTLPEWIDNDYYEIARDGDQRLDALLRLRAYHSTLRDGKHDAVDLSIAPARAEYDMWGWREPRVGEPAYAINRAGQRFPLVYDVHGHARTSAHGDDGLLDLTGRIIVESDTSEFLTGSPPAAARRLFQPDATIFIATKPFLSWITAAEEPAVPPVVTITLLPQNEATTASAEIQATDYSFSTTTTSQPHIDAQGSVRTDLFRVQSMGVPDAAAIPEADGADTEALVGSRADVEPGTAADIDVEPEAEVDANEFDDGVIDVAFEQQDEADTIAVAEIHLDHGDTAEFAVNSDEEQP